MFQKIVLYFRSVVTISQHCGARERKFRLTRKIYNQREGKNKFVYEEKEQA